MIEAERAVGDGRSFPLLFSPFPRPYAAACPMSDYDFELDESEDAFSPPRAIGPPAASAYDFEIEDESFSSSSSPGAPAAARAGVPSSFSPGIGARTSAAFAPGGAVTRNASFSPSSAAARRAAEILARPSADDDDYDASSSSDDMSARLEVAAMHRAAFMPARGGIATTASARVVATAPPPPPPPPPPSAPPTQRPLWAFREENADAAEISEEESESPSAIVVGARVGGAAPTVGGGARFVGVSSPPAERQRELAPGLPIAPSSSARALRAGTRVWALYRSGDEWVEGVVAGSNGDDTWGVAYDDGDEEEAVPLARLRRHADEEDYSAEDFEEWTAAPIASPDLRPSKEAAVAVAAAQAHVASSPPAPLPTGAAASETSSPRQQASTAAVRAPLPAPTSLPAPATSSEVSTAAPSVSNTTSTAPSHPPVAAMAPPPLPIPAPTAPRPTATAPPPPLPPSFNSGLGSLALLLAAHAPFLSVGSSSLSAVLAAGGSGSGSGARPAGASPLPQRAPSKRSTLGPLPASAPSSAFLRALADGLATTPDATAHPENKSTAGTPAGAVARAAVHARLHPAVVASLAAAQASLVSVDVVYARQLAAIRDGAARSRAKLDASIARVTTAVLPMAVPGGSPTAGAQARSPPEKKNTSVGFAVRARLAAPERLHRAPPLSFAEALARVRLDG